MELNMFGFPVFFLQNAAPLLGPVIEGVRWSGAEIMTIITVLATFVLDAVLIIVALRANNSFLSIRNELISVKSELERSVNTIVDDLFGKIEKEFVRRQLFDATVAGIYERIASKSDVTSALLKNIETQLEMIRNQINSNHTEFDRLFDRWEKNNNH